MAQMAAAISTEDFDAAHKQTVVDFRSNSAWGKKENVIFENIALHENVTIV